MAELLMLHRERSKPELRSDDEAIQQLRNDVFVARQQYIEVRALEAQRDEALYVALHRASVGIEHASYNPEAFEAICQEMKPHGRSIASRFIDLMTDGTLNDERRAEYASAALWFLTPMCSGFSKDDDPGEVTGEARWRAIRDQKRQIELVRKKGGVVAIAAEYRRQRDFEHGKIWNEDDEDDEDDENDLIIGFTNDSPPRLVIPSGGREAPIIIEHVSATAGGADSNIRADFARDVIEHFGVTGKCLDPCRGGRGGGFFDALPKRDRHWCEITRGRDFLDWREHVDWCVANPPWDERYREIAKHAFEIAEHVLFLVRLDVALNTFTRIDDFLMHDHAIKEICVVPWRVAFGPDGPNYGFTLALIHWERGYVSDTFTYWKEHNLTRCDRHHPIS